MPHRRKMPSLTDYEPEPARERSPADQKRLETLFPRTDADGRPIPLGDRVSRMEAVTLAVVDAQIEAAPKIESAHIWINDEQNARTSAMNHAEQTSKQLNETNVQLAEAKAMITSVQRTQGVRESRSRMMQWALAAPVAVCIVGLWLKADFTALATAVAAIVGVSVAIVNKVAERSGGPVGKNRNDDLGSSLPPPSPKG